MPRMNNGITYRTETELYGDDYDEPMDRGTFIQIIRLANGMVVCTYCGKSDVPQKTGDIYGPVMMRLNPKRPNVPEEFDLRETAEEIEQAAEEWKRAETARKKAADDPHVLRNIEAAMKTRFATTMACDRCIGKSDEKVYSPPAPGR